MDKRLFVELIAMVVALLYAWYYVEMGERFNRRCRIEKQTVFRHPARHAIVCGVGMLVIAVGLPLGESFRTGIGLVLYLAALALSVWCVLDALVFRCSVVGRQVVVRSCLGIRRFNIRDIESIRKQDCGDRYRIRTNNGRTFHISYLVSGADYFVEMLEAERARCKT